MIIVADTQTNNFTWITKTIRTLITFPQSICPFVSALVYLIAKLMLQLFSEFQVLPSEKAFKWGSVWMTLYFLGRGLHLRRVTTVTRCSLPPSGLGQVGRHGDWVVTDFVTGLLGHHVWVDLKFTHVRRYEFSSRTHSLQFTQKIKWVDSTFWHIICMYSVSVQYEKHTHSLPSQHQPPLFVWGCMHFE